MVEIFWYQLLIVLILLSVELSNFTRKPVLLYSHQYWCHQSSWPTTPLLVTNLLVTSKSQKNTTTEWS